MTNPPIPTTVSDLTGTWTLDPAHTRMGFHARHAMVTKVRGHFTEFEGTAVVDGSDLAASKVNVTIQTASIDTYNEQRDAHLRSNDFLAMDEYPRITFTSTRIEPTGPMSFDLTGDLSIKDVTRSITIPFEFQGAAIDPFGNQRAGFEGSVTINRKDFGVTWNAPLETGGMLVSDKVVLEFDVSAIKNA